MVSLLLVRRNVASRLKKVNKLFNIICKRQANSITNTEIQLLLNYSPGELFSEGGGDNEGDLMLAPGDISTSPGVLTPALSSNVSCLLVSLSGDWEGDLISCNISRSNVTVTERLKSTKVGSDWNFSSEEKVGEVDCSFVLFSSGMLWYRLL